MTWWLSEADKARIRRRQEAVLRAHPGLLRQSIAWREDAAARGAVGFEAQIQALRRLA